MHDKPYRIAKHSKISRMMFSDGNFWDSGLHPLIVVFTLNGMKFTRFSYGDQINAIIFFLRDPNGFTVLRNPSAIAQHIAIQGSVPAEGEMTP